MDIHHDAGSDLPDNISVTSSHGSLSRLETAKVDLAYAEKEIELKQNKAILEENEKILKAKLERQRAEIENKLVLLDKQKQVEISELEVKIEQSSVCSRPRTPEPNKHTERYLPTPYHDRPMPILDLQMDEKLNVDQSSNPDRPMPVLNSQTDENRNQSPKPVVNRDINNNNTNNLSTTQNPQEDLANFLLKKDLMLHRFSVFDDRAENYLYWKTNFQALIQELSVSSREQYDLLVRYLGPESKRHAIRIQAANGRNINNAVKRLWDRLDERYGAPELIDASLRSRLSSFQKIDANSFAKLYDLSDLLSEVQAASEDPLYRDSLSYLNTAGGVNPILTKLPGFLQGKWTQRATEYKRTNNVLYPPFSFFVQFVVDNCSMLNDPSFQFGVSKPPKDGNLKNRNVFSKKTGVESQSSDTESKRSNGFQCFLHGTNSHNMQSCREFKKKSLAEKKQILRENKLCYKCCFAGHSYRNCQEMIKCSICQRESHCTVMHPPVIADNGGEIRNQGGEQVNSKCTQICNNPNFTGRSCSKTILCHVYPEGEQHRSIITYAVIDDQSNRSLAKSKLFDALNLRSESIEYSLSSCGGTMTVSGKQGYNLVVEALNSSCSYTIPSVIECDEIPDNREEIPTPDMAHFHDHLSELSSHLPPLDPNAQILLLIGRDIPEVHHVERQLIGPRGTPFGQKLGLGWVIVGNVCLGKIHSVKVMKTHLHSVGRGSIFEPCELTLNVKTQDYLAWDIFGQTASDNVKGLSQEDRQFLQVMDRYFRMGPDGRWVAPLPFRESRFNLPNNFEHAQKRALSLDKSLKRDANKWEHFKIFMANIFQNSQAEVAPPLAKGQECWYLPVFGVYHPKKPDRIRAVFDSSSKYKGVSLNDVLLQGPNPTNSLLGVLIRFRENPIAIAADIQQMFYCFKVESKHLDYLRFLWYQDNDITKPLIQYRMKVHVFGNSPSPSVATYGLRKAVENAEQKVKAFVNNNFYVDDGMTSVKGPDDAINLIRNTQCVLQQNGHIKLHKIASNSKEVMNAFPQDDLSKDLKEIDLWSDQILPVQRTLGLIWDLNKDIFTFEVSNIVKPYTRRGVLSTIKSLYDPLGFIAPIVLRGRIIQRQLTESSLDWDAQLPEEFLHIWEKWRESLSELAHVEISRVCIPKLLIQNNTLAKSEIHVFCDASQLAIASVAYLKTVDNDGKCFVGFLMGKSKVAPSHCTTIPRLELCAAVLASELCYTVTSHLSINIDQVKFYTDSKVVLGYLNNRKRRFYTYVTNRVDKILKFTSANQWNFIPTDQNPADSGTRFVSVHSSLFDLWLSGPGFLLSHHNESEICSFDLVNPEDDKEIRPIVSTQATSVKQIACFETIRFAKFSDWSKLVCALAALKRKARSISKDGLSIGTDSRLDSFRQTELFIVRLVQEESYKQEISVLKAGESVSKQSVLRKLDPFIDENGLLRVGGRLRKAKISANEKHPIILPGRSHIASLIIRHFHCKVFHQGRHITEGAVQSGGYWLVGGKSVISSFIYKCVGCKRHRGQLSSQKMADLPSDRLLPGPPFSSVGVDAFGPFEVVTRKTRGGQANSKRWGVIFTCLTTSAIHIEIIESMSSSSFINALRRFIAIRGKVDLFRSDRGTNFVGATDKMKIDSINIEDNEINQFLFNQGCCWKFNPPHASHMGGVWERLIGVKRRILDVMLSEISDKNLTHEVLVTFMCEVMAIVNARPLTSVSTDPDMPMVLSPSVLLNQKVVVDMPEINSDPKDMYLAQWKRVKLLADTFWKRWQREFLQTLQNRQKWQENKPNLEIGDIVLMREKTLHRNQWPLGRVINAFPDDDTKVRKVEVEVIQNDKRTSYVRPCTELVLLLSEDN